MPASGVVALADEDSRCTSYLHHNVHRASIMPADAPKVVPEANSSSSSSSSTTAPAAAAAETTMSPKELEEATKNLTARVCGSPAVDGYAYVVVNVPGGWRASLPGGFGAWWPWCLGGLMPLALMPVGFGDWWFWCLRLVYV